MFKKVKEADVKSLIGQGNKVEGNITFTEGFRIDGELVGNIKSEKANGLMIVSETGLIKGSIHADSVVINGVVEGPIYAKTVELQEKAKIKGDIFYQTIKMSQGAIISGSMNHSNSQSSPNPIGELLVA
jgi:cytoskeletal protein CcmA (bactofilin family)